MRHLLLAKVALLALLLLGFALPAAAAPREAAASTFVADISSFFGELVANLFATEAPADPEVAHGFPPNGLTGGDTGEDPEVAHVSRHAADQF